mgnify:CR=1 FL=1
MVVSEFGGVWSRWIALAAPRRANGQPLDDPCDQRLIDLRIDRERHQVASMEGAAFAGDMVARAEAAWNAGCDMLIICNSPDAVGQVLESWKPDVDTARSSRIGRLLPTAPALSWATMSTCEAYLAGCSVIRRLAETLPEPHQT